MSKYWECQCGFFNEVGVYACRKCKQPQYGARATPPSDATVFLTISETAELLRLDPKTVSSMKTRGIFVEGKHFYHPRGEIGVRFDKDAIIAWLKQGAEREQGIAMANGGVARGNR